MPQPATRDLTRPFARRTTFSDTSTAAGSRRTEIPPDRAAFGSFYQLRDKSESNCRAIIEEAAAGQEPDRLRSAKMGDLYNSFMNEPRAELLGKTPIDADLARIDGIAEKSAVIPIIASFQREGVTGLFGAFVSQRLQEVRPVHPLLEPGRALAA